MVVDLESNFGFGGVYCLECYLQRYLFEEIVRNIVYQVFDHNYIHFIPHENIHDLDYRFINNLSRVETSCETYCYRKKPIIEKYLYF